MKNNILRNCTAVALCLSMLIMPSCIGNFQLTNRLHGWNKTIGNKFQNELVFFAFWILPVYEVTILSDLLVLNSIEFWTGTNPMAKGTKVIDGNDGRYLVRCDGKGYDIESLTDGSSVRLDFDAKAKTWSYTADNETHTLFTFIDDTHMLLPVDASGNSEIFEISAAGVAQYQAIANKAMFASR